MHKVGEPVPKAAGAGRASPSRARLRILLLAGLGLVTPACGILINPVDLDPASTATRFWGVAGSAGTDVQLQVLNPDGGWDVLAHATSGGAAVYAGSHNGFYFELTYNTSALDRRYVRSFTAEHGGQYTGFTFRMMMGNGQFNTLGRYCAGSNATVEDRFNSCKTASSVVHVLHN